MTDFVAKQTVVNTIKNHFSSGNITIDLVLGVIVTAVTGYIFNNLHKLNVIIEKIVNYFWKKEEHKLEKVYQVSIDNNTEIIPMQHSNKTSENLLVVSILKYVEKNSKDDSSNGKVTLDYLCRGSNIYNQLINRKIIFKPLEDMYITGEFSGIWVCYNESKQQKETEKEHNRVITTKTSLTIKSNISIAKIHKFIKYCYKEYIEETYSHMKKITEKYLLTRAQYSNQYTKISIKLTKTFDNIYFPEKERLITYVDKFLKNESRSSKFVLLLHGPPGTGKTSVIKALANYTKRHLQIDKFSEIKNSEDINRSFYDDRVVNIRDTCYIPQNKRIHVLEDIDVESDVCHNRNKIEVSKTKEKSEDMVKDELKNTNTSTNTQKSFRISLSDVLQLFDGLYEKPGMMFVITTNCLDILDPAFLRPGRITMKIHMGKMTTTNAFKLIRSYYDENHVEKMFNCIKDKTITPAELENLCNESNDIMELKKIVEEFFANSLTTNS